MAPRKLLVLLLVTTLLAASCGRVVESPSAPARRTPVSPCDERGDTFAGDVKLARCLTEWFWEQRFQQAGETYRPITRFVAYHGEDGPDCGDQKSVPDNAFYCPYGHFVAFDATWLQQMYDRMGDGSVYVVIPHELGHAVQAQLGTRFRYNAERELQADCYAGATLSGLIRAGMIQEESGDESELLTNLEAAGDPTDAWWAPDAHGTPEERQTSFAQGFNEGPSAC
ncbi:neutral zinc metallopeptidase [Microbispora sp. ATCC PTA-5024]|uniref:neutral zinc metallopeptidase n=1 Tax=Microbispora sp. ATCC PTA-5024 TaxID=316330 RepID=UPI000565F916|nr:neutral zinc metallopeptidase [Microbispora sp. ATCC PTA-5024]